MENLIDGQNRRIGKKLNGQIVLRLIYEGRLRPIAEIDSLGNIVAQYVYGMKVNVPEYIIKGGNIYQVITDHLGSVRLVVDQSTGAIIQNVAYDEWGNILTDSNPCFTPFGYVHGLYDTQTRLVRFGARDYEASSGRWTVKDPIGFGGGVSNLFEYCVNDPVNYFDPEGFKRYTYDEMVQLVKTNNLSGQNDELLRAY